VASHNQHSADIVPFPVDYAAPRFVRPIPEEQIARIMGEPVDCYQAFKEAELEREALTRRTRLQAIIEWLCVALVIATTIYFAAEFARSHFNQAASSSNLARPTH
jgi:hypothetical protein